MEEQLFAQVAQQGVWAALFIFLFLYQPKESRRQQEECRSREDKLVNFINDMSKNFETLGKQYEHLSGDVQEIKITLSRKN